MATETYSSSGFFDSMLELRAKNKIYTAERKEANALPHRRRDLEAAIAIMQLSPFAARVHEVLDQHSAALPPISEQDDEDRVWRLAIHRMDLRRYTVLDKVAEDATGTKCNAAHGPERQYVRLALTDIEPDIREMTRESATEFEAMITSSNLMLWGFNVFKHENTATYDPMQWRQRLMQAQNVPAADSIDVRPDIDAGGPGFVAAVCARDHWDEMSDDEREWVVNLICDEVMREADTWNNYARGERN